MLIPNNLRQESMPKMVYFLCKFIVTKKCKKDELKEYITASIDKMDSEDSKQFDRVYSFCEDGGFIHIDEGSGIIETFFTEDDIVSFEVFMNSCLSKLEKNEEGLFDQVLKWLFDQNYNTLEGLSAAKEFAARIDISGVDENYVHGFFFWLEAFGMIKFSEWKAGQISFSMGNLLLSYLNDHDELKKNGSILISDFLNKISDDIYFIEYCYANNKINFCLSQALRILEKAGFLETEYHKDTGDEWQLFPIGEFAGATITDIKVL